jgi:hypothetical protein
MTRNTRNQKKTGLTLLISKVSYFFPGSSKASLADALTIAITR